MENKNRKLCRSCKYSNQPNLWTVSGRCNYICVTGHSRGCPASDCDKYERGRRLPIKTDKTFVINGNRRDNSLRGRKPLTEEERAERKRKRERERYWKNREKNLAYQKEYRRAHKEEIRERYWKNREKNLAYQKEYRRAYKEELAEYQKNYRQEHKEEIREKKRQKRLIAGVDGNTMEIPRKVEE